MRTFITVLLAVLSVAHASAADRGEQLAAQYCGSCHVQPLPEVLDKTTWVAKVFPIMRQYIGLDPKTDLGNNAHTLRAFFPLHPMMTEDEWYLVAEWYLNNAPRELPSLSRRQLTSTRRFRADSLVGLSANPPMTVMVIPRPDSAGILVGHAMNGTITTVHPSGRTSVLSIGGPPISVAHDKGDWLIADMGKLLPHDSAVGSIWRYRPTTPNKPPSKEIKGLWRPTNVVAGDLNGDGRMDLVVCEFGNHRGRFGWYERTKKGWKYHLLIDRPGAIKSEIADVDGDGRVDIVVLLAQSNEELVLFRNVGRGHFVAQQILGMHPAFGASSFSLIDFDSDGDLDIVLTNGDNGDYEAPPLKPYHGVRLLRNEGKGSFVQRDFLPQYGCYGALIVDFDGDGDLDIVSYSFFSDYSANTSDALLYWEQQDDGSFVAHSMPSALDGRWLVACAYDVDGDGDTDVILGNAAFGPGTVPGQLQQKWASEGLVVRVLVNTTR